MALAVNTNLLSLNTQRNLSASQASLATSMQRLSSGLRINSAKDDAAGYAISQRFTSQIDGTQQASRNANDGISLAQTAGGVLTEIGNNLQRMRDLSVQASNATASDSDRATINNEVQALATEIDRVAQSTSFNGTKLLDGSFSAKNFQVGANNSASDSIQITSISSARTSALGGVTGTGSATVTGTATSLALNAGDLTLNGIQVGASTAGKVSGQTADSAYSIAAAINAVSGQSNVTASAQATNLVGAAPLAAGAIAANTFSINGVNVGAVANGGNATGQGANVAAAINQVSSQTGVIATADALTGAVTLGAADGRNITIAGNTSNTGLLGGTATVTGAVPAAAAAIAANAFQINGVNIGAIGAGGSVAAQGVNVAAAINLVSSQTGVTAAADGATGKVTLSSQNGAITVSGNVTNTGLTAATTATGGSSVTGAAPAIGAVAAGALTINGTSVGAVVAGGTAVAQGTNLAAAINAVTGTTGVSAAADSVTGKLTLSSATGAITVGGTAPALNTGLTAGTTATSSATHGTVNLTSTAAITVSGGAVASAGLSAGTTASTPGATVSTIATMNTLTATNALKAIDTIDSALASITNSQAALGAYQNRFASVMASQATTIENFSASRSRIQDADFATETANLSRSQILQQAGMAMLAQANQSSQGVLALLR